MVLVLLSQLPWTSSTHQAFPLAFNQPPLTVPLSSQITEERMHADRTVSHLYESGYLHGVSEPAKKSPLGLINISSIFIELFRYHRRKSLFAPYYNSRSPDFDLKACRNSRLSSSRTHSVKITLFSASHVHLTIQRHDLYPHRAISRCVP